MTHECVQSHRLLLNHPHPPPHLWREEFAHIAVGVPCVETKLCGPRLGPQQVPLGLRGAVDLIVDVLTGVHVETGVEEGAVAEALVCVLVDDATVWQNIKLTSQSKKKIDT